MRNRDDSRSAVFQNTDTYCCFETLRSPLEAKKRLRRREMWQPSDSQSESEKRLSSSQFVPRFD